MSITNPDCPQKFCEFCDEAADVYHYYCDMLEKEGRIPGLIDEAN